MFYLTQIFDVMTFCHHDSLDLPSQENLMLTVTHWDIMWSFDGKINALLSVQWSFDSKINALFHVQCSKHDMKKIQLHRCSVSNMISTSTCMGLFTW
jgi:hypothetical protein